MRRHAPALPARPPRRPRSRPHGPRRATDDEPHQEHDHVARARADGVGVRHVAAQYEHRVVAEAREHGDERPPAEVPERGRHEGRHDRLLGRRVEALHEVDVDEVEEVENPDPGDACDEVRPAQNDPRQLAARRRVEYAVEHRDAHGEMQGWLEHLCPPIYLLCDSRVRLAQNARARRNNLTPGPRSRLPNGPRVARVKARAFGLGHGQPL